VAKHWAKTLSGERERTPGYSQKEELVLRELWERYSNASFHTLRSRTQANYTERWRDFERFAGPYRSVDDIKPELVDQWRAFRSKQGLAVNQSAETLKVVKMVFRWAELRELIGRNRLTSYRFKTGKEEQSPPIEEYSPDDFPKLLEQLNPRSVREWRAWAITSICGSQGARINAVLHLRWDDIDFEDASICWRKRWDKQGLERIQPLTDIAKEALLVALGWSTKDQTQSGWVFYTPTRKKQARGDNCYHVSSYWRMLMKAEQKAGIAHSPGRAAHGLRRMSAGNALAITNNPVIAMHWIGDTDLSTAKRYLKKRDAALVDVAKRMKFDGGAVVQNETALKPQRGEELERPPSQLESVSQ
jgi:integrase